MNEVYTSIAKDLYELTFEWRWETIRNTEWCKEEGGILWVAHLKFIEMGIQQ